MSGHSKWSTIKRAKGANDIKRGQTFTKIANAISLAARLGGNGEPESNPKLRLALESARRVNMPKENINRAIDRGLGKLPGQSFEEVTYEGFGPGKVSFYIEGVTDNKLRTSQEIRNIFDRAGGNLGNTGSTVYMFDKKGEIKVKSKGGVTDEEILELIDLGVEDVEDYEEDGVTKYLLYTEPSVLGQKIKEVSEKDYEVEESGIIMKPNISVEIVDTEVANKVIEFAQRIEDLDDVQKVYANFIVNT